MKLSKEKGSVNIKPVRRESLLKHFFTIDTSSPSKLPPSQSHSVQLSPKRTLKLPKISKLTEDDHFLSLINSKSNLEQTVKNIKHRFYAPHGASRAKKYDLIKYRKMAEVHSPTYNYISKSDRFKLKDELTLQTPSIISCSLQESIFHG